MRLLDRARWVAGVLVLAGLATGTTGVTSAVAMPKLPSRIRVDLGLTATQARWTPGRKGGTGRLTFTGIAPRMAMVAIAPRRELADVPAATIASNWRKLFGADLKTNAILGAKVGGRSRLFAVELKLLDHTTSGSEMHFAVTPLRSTQNHPARLGRKRLTLDSPTLVVDPVVTDAVRALWTLLASLFTPADPAPATPPADPVTVQQRGGPTVFETDGGTYAGTDGTVVDTTAGRIAAQTANLNALGATFDPLTNPEPDVTFGTGDIRGAALFGANFGDVLISGPGNGSQTVRDFAIYDARVNDLSVVNADVGGVNLRATDITSFNAANSAFQTVDLTGASLGDQSARSSVSNSVFIDVSSNRSVTGGDGQPDAVNGRTAFDGTRFDSIDFSSVSFLNADFAGASINSTTFQGCGLSNFDFTGAAITGETGTTTDQAGNSFSTLQPSFENSILDTVKFDGAKIANVSFAGVDFSQGVSLDGAHLENVDFTGAIGLQFVDWSTVTVDGPVYGLAQFGDDIGTLSNQDDLRSFSTDGALPEIDPATGYDVQYGTGFLVDPATGVRLARVGFGGGLVPIDPTTGKPMVDPESGSEIEWTGSGLLDPSTGAPVDVDYFSGIPDFGGE
jgi:uncharacterized protein YjbI with pentapeptide repeats